MIELIWVAFKASAMGLVAPLGVGWVWGAALARHGVTPLPLGTLYWLGVMSLGGAVLLGHGAGLPRPVVVCFVILMSTAGWLWNWRREERERVAGHTGAWPLVPLAVAGVSYCVIYPVQMWDGYLIWLARVRLLENWIPLSRFRDLRIVYPEYPFLGPAAWWWTEWAARVPVEAGRVVFVFAYVAFFSAVLARERNGVTVPFRLLWTFVAYACFSLQIINGYQDGFLMVSAGMVALIYLQLGDRGAVWIPLVAAGLSFIKAEGAVLGLLLVFSWLIAQPSRLKHLCTSGASERRKALLGLLGCGLILAVWPWLQARNGLDLAQIQGNAFQIHSMEIFQRQADRIPDIVLAIARQYTWSFWLTIPFFAAVVSALVGRDLDRGRRFLLIFLILHLLFIIAVFWATQAPFEWHLSTALERLLLQGRMVMMLFVFETAARQWTPFSNRSNVAFAGALATLRKETHHYRLGAAHRLSGLRCAISGALCVVHDSRDLIFWPRH